MTSGVADIPRPGRPPAAGELAWHTLGADQVLRSQGVDGQHGLSSAEAAARARQFGRNEFAAGRAEPRWHAFFRQYRDPMQLVLLAAGIGSLYPLKQLGTGVLLILLTLFNAAVAFAIAAIPVGLPTVVTTILAWGTEQLAQAGAIMKRLASTQTLGSTSAINSDKTGTLTLNQMTAVQMTAAGRRYAIDGQGYSTAGRITRVGGQAEIGLDEFLVPMVLASDAVVRDGELIGDPTEGALVVLAAKGGIDAVSTRDRYPRIAELPFDAAYKMMATFHQMTDASGQEVIRCFVKGAPEQLLARAATVFDADACECRLTAISGSGTWLRTSGWASRACG